MPEPFNRDVAVLAKKVYELSTLSPDALEARKWEALIILTAVHGSATQEGIDKANADKETRWGDKIRAEGLLSALHPKWHLRTDDGKPPAAKFALVSALSNPKRDLRARYAALQFVAADERAPLDDIVRAFASDAFNNAKGDSRIDFIDVMRTRTTNPKWWMEPWLCVLPYDGNLPPASILVENQGETHDGGIFDDPADDTMLEQWRSGIRTWNVDFLRDNPLAVLYTKLDTATTKVLETAGEVASGANEAAKGIAKILKWAPYVVAGIGAIGLTAMVLAAARSAPASA